MLKFNVFKWHGINSLMDTAQDNNSLDSLDLTDLKDSLLSNTAVKRQLQFHLLVKIEAYDIRYLKGKKNIKSCPSRTQRGKFLNLMDLAET